MYSLSDKVAVSLDIPREKLENLLISALEGGSNYWYMIQSEVQPREWTYWGSHNEQKTQYAHLLPFNEGGALMIDDEAAGDEKELATPVRLDWDALVKGLQVWALDAAKSDDDKTRTAHPCHFADMLKDNGDATTGDVYLQYCLFGKVIYG